MEIKRPDDFHHHLRDNDILKHTTLHAKQNFGRVLVMPNTIPPITNLAQASKYRDRILAAFPSVDKNENNLQLLMTLYLTDVTTPEEVADAFASGVVYAVKLYPAGATTNSQSGVTDIVARDAVFQKMAEIGIPLLIHGETTDPTVDIFMREQVFIETILAPLIARHPTLKIVLEHITTAYAVNFILNSNNANVAATISVHHLLYSYNDIFCHGINPHMFCLPILKSEANRQALLAAATSGNPKFFAGTDSAPHPVYEKESGCGRAGIFTAHAAVELYTEIFETQNALDKLENFCSVYGAQFYGLPVNADSIQLVKEDWIVPATYPFGDSVVKPLKAGEVIHWKIVVKEYA